MNSMLSMVPNIVFVPNICRTQNTDTGRKTQTQLITGLYTYCFYVTIHSHGLCSFILKIMIDYCSKA